MYGLWIVFEGADGVGKSTTMKAVAAILRSRLPDVEIVETRHPGSTALGQYIRDITKNPQKYGIDIDPLSTQMLMFADHINFKKIVLEPALERGAIVLADRCDLISGLVYGSATGLHVYHLNALMSLACSPRIDMLYVLRCDQQVQEERLHTRAKANQDQSTMLETECANDRFEVAELRQQINTAYETLITGNIERTIMVNKIVPLENIKYIESGRDVNIIAHHIAREIMNLYRDSLY